MFVTLSGYAGLHTHPEWLPLVARLIARQLLRQQLNEFECQALCMQKMLVVDSGGPPNEYFQWETLQFFHFVSLLKR